MINSPPETRGGGGMLTLFVQVVRLEYTKKPRLRWHVVTVAKGAISILNIKTTFHSLWNAYVRVNQYWNFSSY